SFVLQTLYLCRTMALLEQPLHYLLYIPLGILSLLLLIQLYYIFFVYGKLSLYKVKSFREIARQPPISVIICAHNEEENLKKFLPGILEQDYPQFEVILVDDCSDD